MDTQRSSVFSSVNNTMAVPLFLISRLSLVVVSDRLSVGPINLPILPDRPNRCPQGKVFETCGSACANLCPSLGLFCPSGVCISGCFCPPEQIDVGGICKDKTEYCITPECPAGQTFNECGNACDDYCPDTKVMCPVRVRCTAGCYCPYGQMKIDGECVDQKKYCELIDCGPNATWRNGTGDKDSCFAVSHMNFVFEGCFCNDGYRYDMDKCVPCLTNQECPEGLTFNLCGKDCFDDCPDPTRVCSTMCQPGCYCPDGFVNVDGSCVVTKEHCKDTDTTPRITVS